MLNYVDYCLFKMRQRLEQQHPKPNANVKRQLQLIDVNLTKIGVVVSVLLLNSQRKNLYDFAMGFTEFEELDEIAHLLGGKIN
jgi:hypothetical protein